METPSARRLAEERHAFMLQFLTQFEQEWKLS
jgi:HD superfamily phosphodiesterase